MERDRRAVRTRVDQGVVLERRNETTGRAASGFHLILFAETVDAVVLREEVVLRDLHLAVDDALDAPDAGVIVQRRALAGTPLMTTAV
jgi:hypothetical protein